MTNEKVDLRQKHRQALVAYWQKQDGDCPTLDEITQYIHLQPMDRAHTAFLGHLCGCEECLTIVRLQLQVFATVRVRHRQWFGWLAAWKDASARIPEDELEAWNIHKEVCPSCAMKVALTHWIHRVFLR